MLQNGFEKLPSLLSVSVINIIICHVGTLDPRGIKQADVVLLSFPLLWNMPDDVRRNDLELYEPITNPNGPAMTWSIFAIKYKILSYYL